MPEAASAQAKERTASMFTEGWLSRLHVPGGNAQIHESLRESHLAATGGKVVTRFPPEPNGFLHIGHSKAITVNFGYAAHHGGHCILRYDDTNPEAEEQVYFDSILSIIQWLGFSPAKITYSSDHFEDLYRLAQELIRRDKAYMCFCTPAQIAAGRGGPEHGPRSTCAHRDAPVDASLAAFADMRAGKYAPSEAVLRMKQDMDNPSPQMWDLIAYRTLRASHHRTGDTWCIYPTYDFTHCLCDSFENISHSLCTTEFILSRESYDWLCDALEVYKPRQSEYGRLNLEGTVMSKRKIAKLVNEGHVNGWDDPRLYTLIALKRRGIPPGAILDFVSNLGVSTATTTIKIHRFEQCVRSFLEFSVPRLMLILRPIKLVFKNLPADFHLPITKPLHTKDESFGTNTVPFTREIYIDADDFRTEDSKGYFRLAPGKTVGLLYVPCPITCTSFKADDQGNVTEITCKYEQDHPSNDPERAIKVKAYIHWVGVHAASQSPVPIKETRCFKRLFKSDNPASLDNFLEDIDPDSLTTYSNALVETGIRDIAKAITAKAEVGDNERLRFQAMRTAYFTLDSSAKLPALNEADDKEELVLNWIVSLKEDKEKEGDKKPAAAPAKPKPPKMKKQKKKDVEEKKVEQLTEGVQQAVEGLAEDLRKL